VSESTLFPAASQALPLSLLRAREAAMAFFRPVLNQHGLTEQQWRVIRILVEQGQMESQQLAEHACILKPSLTGVLARLQRDGLVHRYKSTCDRRRVYVVLSEQGQQRFNAMQAAVEHNYQRIGQQFGLEKIQRLSTLLEEFSQIKP